MSATTSATGTTRSLPSCRGSPAGSNTWRKPDCICAIPVTVLHIRNAASRGDWTRQRLSMRRSVLLSGGMSSSKNTVRALVPRAPGRSTLMLANRTSLSIGAFRTITVCAVLLGLPMTICGPAHAQTQPQTPPASAGPPAPNGQSSAPANAPERLSPVVVTGTSIQSAQAAAYESAPIAIITGEDLQRAGVANIEDYFQTQPNFVLSGQSSYSNTTAASGLNGTQIGGTTLNLRGIGPQYTLVLVNGRRFQAEDPANLDLIPLDAIDRIEVLKSGASAVYGSDAVAGVVNIITKRSANGWSVGTYYGESSDRDDK